MSMKDSDFKAIVANMEADLQKSYEAEKANLLAKAAGDEPEESKSPEAEASASPPVDESSSPAPEAPVAGGAAPGDGPPAMDPAAGGDPGGAPMTVDALVAEYQQLAQSSPQEFEMHLQAIQMVLDQSGGGAGGPPGPEASASAAPPPGPEASGSMPNVPAASPQDDTMPPSFKSELDNMQKLFKAEIEALKAAHEAERKDSEENTQNLTKAVTLLLEQPKRKGITSISQVKKSEDEPKILTKAELKAELKRIGSDPKLEKSKAKLINQYFLGNIKESQLYPLFEDKK